MYVCAQSFSPISPATSGTCAATGAIWLVQQADVMEAEFDRSNSRYDIPSVDKAVGRRPERSVVSGDEIRPPDARRAEDEDLSRVKIFVLSCSVHRHQCDGRPCESRTIINAE